MSRRWQFCRAVRLTERGAVSHVLHSCDGSLLPAVWSLPPAAPMCHGCGCRRGSDGGAVPPGPGVGGMPVAPSHMTVARKCVLGAGCGRPEEYRHSSSARHSTPELIVLACIAERVLVWRSRWWRARGPKAEHVGQWDVEHGDRGLEGTGGKRDESARSSSLGDVSASGRIDGSMACPRRRF